MLVVSDTSPLINLAIIGRLDLLPRLYGQVIVPEAVFHEIVVQGAGELGAEEISQADWVKVKSCSDQIFLKTLLHQLDPGEAEAIALAVELSADRILMDESEGRRIAAEHSLRTVGVLGVLLRAKREGLIPELAAEMQRLTHEAGFFIHPNLYKEVLEMAGER